MKRRQVLQCLDERGCGSSLLPSRVCVSGRWKLQLLAAYLQKKLGKRFQNGCHDTAMCPTPSSLQYVRLPRLPASATASHDHRQGPRWPPSPSPRQVCMEGPPSSSLGKSRRVAPVTSPCTYTCEYGGERHAWTSLLALDHRSSWCLCRHL